MYMHCYWLARIIYLAYTFHLPMPVKWFRTSAYSDPKAWCYLYTYAGQSHCLSNSLYGNWVIGILGIVQAARIASWVDTQNKLASGVWDAASTYRDRTEPVLWWLQLRVQSFSYNPETQTSFRHPDQYFTRSIYPGKCSSQVITHSKSVVLTNAAPLINNKNYPKYCSARPLQSKYPIAIPGKATHHQRPSWEKPPRSQIPIPSIASRSSK